MKKWLLVFAVIFVAVLILRRPNRPPAADDELTPQPPPTTRTTVRKSKATENPRARTPTAPAPQARQLPQARPQPTNSAPNPQIAKFHIEDGVAVVQGDMVVGQINGAPPTGNVLLPPVYPWQRNEIPFAINADIERPERVQQAIEMFAGTAVELVPYNGEEDAIVFVKGTGQCKSYVGRVKGKQPIWIAPECDASDVAHEIMHALGFIHEQNRSDRDRFVEIVEPNIKPGFEHNFAKLPDDYMKVTGLTEFDYGSIMMYPEISFSKDGSPTIKPVSPGFKIAPSTALSERDIIRINQEFGRK